MTKPFCVPAECGLSSTSRSVCARLARLLNALETEITGYVVGERDPILDVTSRSKREILLGLREQGYRVEWNDTYHKWRVRAPKRARGAK